MPSSFLQLSLFSHTLLASVIKSKAPPSEQLYVSIDWHVFIKLIQVLPFHRCRRVSCHITRRPSRDSSDLIGIFRCPPLDHWSFSITSIFSSRYSRSFHQSWSSAFTAVPEYNPAYLFHHSSVILFSILSFPDGAGLSVHETKTTSLSVDDEPADFTLGHSLCQTGICFFDYCELYR
jgi:hypothetical protein